MDFKQLHDGTRVPVLGLGTARFGSDLKNDVRAVRTALDLGFGHIDTAEVYQEGRSERAIGQAIKDYDRSKLFVTSKVAKSHLRRDQVLKAIEGSLDRLGTDYLDLYLIHAPDPSVPLEETMEAMNSLVEQGKTRYIGVSNFSVEQMAQAYRLTSSILATNQVHYSFSHREPERNGVLQWCQDHEVLLTAYTPVEHGDVQQSEILSQMAERLGATPIQVALAWLIQQPNVITIPQSRNEAHQRENLGALDVKLSKSDLQKLTDSSNRGLAVG